MKRLPYLAIAGFFGLASAAWAQVPQRAPAALTRSPIQQSPSRAKVDTSLWQPQSPVTVVIRLTNAPLAVAVGKGAKQLGVKLSGSAQGTHVENLLR